MLNYCGILESPFLVLETPAGYVFEDKAVNEAHDFLASASLRGVRLVWENRAPPTKQWKSLLQDFNIVHAVDLSRETPLFPSDVVYTRLFGKGKHNIYQFTDEELEEIDHKVLLSQAKTVALSYHGLRMNTDAIRFVQFKKTGSFPSITGLTGIASAKSVLAEDAKFPASKQELIDKQGWKVFDASAEKRLRLTEWLRRIPDETYSSLDEVAEALGVMR